MRTARQPIGEEVRGRVRFLILSLLMLLLPMLAYPAHAADKTTDDSSFYRIKSLKRAHSTSVKDGGVQRLEQSLAACWREGDGLHIRLDAGLATSGSGLNGKQRLSKTQLLTLKEDNGTAHYVLSELGTESARMEFVQFIQAEDGRTSELRYPMQLAYSPALHVAVWEGKPLASALKVKDAVKAIDHRGRTALMLAAYRGRVEDINILLKAGSEVNHTDFSGQTALMLAVQHPKAVAALLAAKADPALQDAQGFDALPYAMVNADALRLLLDARAAEGRQAAMANAFVWGMVKGSPESLKLLLDSGLPKDAKHLGKSLKDWAVYHKQAEALSLLENP